MHNYCGKCRGEIIVETDNLSLKSFDGIKCASICGRVFHKNCTDLSADCLKLLINIPNLLWQCNSCVVMAGDANNTIDLLSRQMREVQSKCMQLERMIGEREVSKQLAHNIETNETNAPVSNMQTLRLTPVVQSSQQSDDNVCENFLDAVDDPNMVIENRNQEWITVRRKEKKKKQLQKNNNKPNKHKHKRVVGIAPVNDAFEVVHTIKYLHLSKFNVRTEPEAILKFVAESLGVQTDAFKCTKLVKRDADLSKLHFVNFKLGVPAPFFEKVYSKTLWPMSIKITPFISKPKNGGDGIVSLPPPQEETTPISAIATTAREAKTVTTTAITSNILSPSLSRQQ